MIIGTAGHIDHGKTALVRALTGVDADRLPEEKKRGITIDLGFAYQKLAGGATLGFVDVPGHERFVHNMLAGATGIDFVLLVVAANDGVMPQTREHAQILNLLGLDRGVVALTKVDLVDAARIAQVRADIAALLARTTLAGAEIMPVSSVTGAGVAELAARLEAESAKPRRRRATGRFRMAIDRRFTLEGHGTVVTGTVVSGAARIEDRLMISPSGREVRVRRIHAQNAPAESGEAGQRCAINVAGVEIDAVTRGDWLVDPFVHAPTDRIDVRLGLLDSETRPLAHWTQAHVHLGAAHVMGRVALLDCAKLEPGKTALAQLVLDRKIGALAGDRFILRDSSAQRTMAGGAVLDPAPPTRYRRTKERLAVLSALEEPDPAACLARLVALAPHFVDLTGFARAHAIGAGEADAIWTKAGVAIARDTHAAFAIAPARWTELGQRIVAALTEHHAKNPDSPGLDSARLRGAVDPKLPAPLFALALNARAHAKAIVAEGPFWRLPEHRVALGPAEEKLWARIEPTLRAGKFEPPRVRDFATSLAAKEGDVRALMKRLARMGRLVEVAPDHFYLRESVAALVRTAHTVAAKAPGGQFNAGAYRDAIGVGRKLAILILEFFDRAGVTVRQGDQRRVRADRLDLFGKG
jgi:selenocysteine-specific elongation factor